MDGIERVKNLLIQSVSENNMMCSLPMPYLKSGVDATAHASSRNRGSSCEDCARVGETLYCEVSPAMRDHSVLSSLACAKVSIAWRKLKQRLTQLGRLADVVEGTNIMCAISKVDDQEIGKSKIRRSKKAAIAVYKDPLAIVTEKQRAVVWRAYDMFAKWQQTRWYRVLFETTQPAHLLMILAVTVVYLLMSAGGKTISRPSPIITLMYLFSFMIHYGSQFWMTFVSGLSLYFAVPRHTFGEVQRVLFPRYFGINSLLSLVTLVLFVKQHPSNSWDPQHMLQVGGMVFSFLDELIIRLYLAPPLLYIMATKNAMEKAAGVGLEVGHHDPGPLAKCPRYVKLHRKFRKIHMAIAIGNLLSMACTTWHLLYLANKICDI